MAKRNRSKPAPQGRPPDPVRAASHLRALAGAVFVAAIAAAAYFPSLNGEFIFDDNNTLMDNPLIKAPDGLARSWNILGSHDPWPVTNTTLWLEWRLWGMHPSGYHITNLLLHILSALLIWLILTKLSIPAAFLAALLFVAHPVNVESVAWIAQRKGLLAMVFFLLSILCYLNAERQSSSERSGSPLVANRWYWMSLGACALAMLSKGSVAPLPILLLCLVGWLRPLTRQDLARTAPFFLVTAVLVGVNVWIQTNGAATQIRTAGFAERLLGAAAVVWFYLSKAILPLNLAFIYPQWHIEVSRLAWWLPLLAAIALTGTLWRFRHGWSRPFLFAWVYFCAALAPVLGFTDVQFMHYTLVADHYQYVALIGVVALVAAGLGTWQRRARGAPWAPTVISIAMLCMLTGLTWKQSRLYANGISLFQAALQRNPGSWLVHNNLGAALAQAGQPRAAIEQYEQALRLNPEYVEAQHNLGNALRDAGRLPEAIARYRQILQVHPDSPDTHNNLGAALHDSGQLQEAVEQYEQALRLKPDFPEAHHNLAMILAQTGKLTEATAHYEEALQLRPNYPDAEYNLGIALTQDGHLQEAVAHFQQALRLKPDFAEAHNNMGSALAQLGRLAEAINHFQQALRLKPGYADAQYNLRTALAVQQKPVEQRNGDAPTGNAAGP